MINEMRYGADKEGRGNETLKKELTMEQLAAEKNNLNRTYKIFLISIWIFTGVIWYRSGRWEISIVSIILSVGLSVGIIYALGKNKSVMNSVYANTIQIKDDMVWNLKDKSHGSYEAYELNLVTAGKLKVDEEIYRMAECYDPVYLFEFLDRNQKVCFRQIYFRKNVFLSPELEALHEEAQFTIEEMKAMADKRKKDQWGRK